MKIFVQSQEILKQLSYLVMGLGLGLGGEDVGLRIQLQGQKFHTFGPAGCLWLRV